MSSKRKGVSAERSSGELRKGGHYFALPVGTKLLEYKIEKLLGHGGFGITYQALDTVLRESVAIKEYLPNDIAVRVSDETVRPKSDGDEIDFQAGLKSFLEEARVITRFRHPNIVHVRRFFELHGTGYIALDYERGQTLSQRMTSGPIWEAELRNILHGIIDGLSAIHDRAVLHRDLKPSNVMLREDGTPVLIDFGAARDFNERHSRSITAIAAPGYSPPEQYGVGGQQGPWTDIYALGAIAYKCVTGAAPPDSLRRLRNDPLVAATTAASGKYDRELLRTIDWMLAVDEAKRPRSVELVRERLDTETGGRRKHDGDDLFKYRRQPRITVPIAVSLVTLLAVVALAATNVDRIKAILVSTANNHSLDPKKNTPSGSELVETSTDSSKSPANAVPRKPSGPDDLAWDYVKDGSDPEQLRLFIQQFPSSPHREAAAAKLALLGETPPSTPVQPAVAVASPQAAATVPNTSAPAAKPIGPSEDEIAWDFLKETSDPGVLRQFIDRYPTSSRRTAALARLATLDQSKAATKETTESTSKPADAIDDSAIINDPLLIDEIRNRLYELNFDPGPAGNPELLQQAVREYQAINKLAMVGQATSGLLMRLRQMPTLKPWGSIAYGREAEKWGMSWGHETRREAVASARTSCGEQCPTEVSFFGSDCAAFAHSDFSWAIKSRPTLEGARADALKDCEKNNHRCAIIASVCANGKGQLTK